MKKRHNIIIFLVIVALVASLVYMQQSRDPLGSTQSVAVAAKKASIADIEFAYPEKYGVYEKANSPFTKTLTTVVWYEDTPQNRGFFVGAPGSPSEPPVTITLDIYNNENNLTPKQLLNETASYMFLKGEGVPVTLAGKPAVFNEWDGLYSGKSLYIQHKGKLYVFSVTSITSGDAILKDFDVMLGSVMFK